MTPTTLLMLKGHARDLGPALRSPSAREALARAEQIKRGKGSVKPNEAACLHALARQFDRPGAAILEIGTLVGYSAVIMANAAPRADIFTVNPVRHEFDQAARNLAPYHKVHRFLGTSAELFDLHSGSPFYIRPFDMALIDGDHREAAVRLDLRWWERLNPDGLMLFHDYDERGAPDVVRVLDEFAASLGRPFDVAVLGDGADEGRGLVGWYKRLGE